MTTIPNGRIFERLIAVVDNDYAIRDSIGMVLQSHGWRSRLYAIVDELFADTTASTPSCVIIDPGRRGTRGADPVRAIQARYPDSPIIALTATPTSPIVSDFLTAGANVVLTKPVAENVLVKHVSTLVDNLS